MPLTQDRFIAVIDESSRLEQAYNDLRTELYNAVAVYGQDDGLSKQDMTQALLAMIRGTQRPPLENTYVERAHFRKNAKRNEREKERRTHTRQNGPTRQSSKFTPKSSPAPTQFEVEYDQPPASPEDFKDGIF